MLVYHNGTPIWLLHTGLYKFVQNISTNIWSYEKRTDFKLGEVTSFLISHNNTISWLYLPNGFRIIFLFCFIASQCKPRIIKWLVQFTKISDNISLTQEKEFFSDKDDSKWNKIYNQLTVKYHPIFFLAHILKGTT